MVKKTTIDNITEQSFSKNIQISKVLSALQYLLFVWMILGSLYTIRSFIFETLNIEGGLSSAWIFNFLQLFIAFIIVFTFTVLMATGWFKSANANSNGYRCESSFFRKFIRFGESLFAFLMFYAFITSGWIGYLIFTVFFGGLTFLNWYLFNIEQNSAESLVKTVKPHSISTSKLNQKDIKSNLESKNYDYQNVVESKSDDLLYHKFDMKPVTGVIFSKHGNLGEYKNGKKNGLCQTWYDNGQLKAQGTYKNGYPFGLLKLWHKNGRLESSDNYKENKKHSQSRKWNVEGQLIKEENYSEDKLDGAYRQWYDNGQLKSEGKYQIGVMYGCHVFWHENGQKKAIMNYSDGKKINQTCWDENGNRID